MHILRPIRAGRNRRKGWRPVAGRSSLNRFCRRPAGRPVPGSCMSLARRHLLAALLLTAAYFAVLAAMDFHLCLNDFWAWSFLAGRVDLSDPSTLQNGFMPPAYVLFLAVIAPAREIAAAFGLNAVAVAATALATAVLGRRTGVRGAGIASLVLLAVFPPFLQSGMTAGPDIVMVALVAVAATLYWSTGSGVRAGLPAGLLLGLAVLVRSHALFIALGMVVARVGVDRRAGRVDLAVLVGLGLGLATQVALNLAAGEPAWANGQAFNVYKMVNGVDWYDPVRPENLSVVHIVGDAPLAFLREWAGATARAGAWLLGPLLVLAVVRDPGRRALRRLAGLALVAGVIYTVPVALGDSPRAAVVLSGLVLPPTAALLLLVRRRPRSPLAVLTVAVLAFGLVLGLRADRDFLRHNFRQARDFACVERSLHEAGATRAEQVFTDDFDLYFRQLDGRRPLTRGGWGVIGIEGWTDAYPQMPTDDATGFLDACRSHGVRWLALTHRARRMGPVMETFRFSPDRVGASVLATCGEFVILSLPPEESVPPTSDPQEDRP